MFINLTEISTKDPITIGEDEYQALITRKRRGWSHCDSRKEWLCKLHYLRSGYKQGKISAADFEQREKKLVLQHWSKYL